MTQSLKDKTISSVFWSGLERGGQQIVQLGIGIVLARLLSPEEFGLIAMITIFIAVSQAFIDSGFGRALIQKQGATYDDECTVFYFNIVVSLLAAGLLFFAAPFIAQFYTEPTLTNIVRAMSFNLVIMAFGLLQKTLLTKDLDFKTQFKATFTARLFSGSMAIALAYTGWGVWALVAQQILFNLWNTIALWFVNDWRPALIFSRQSFRELFGFGSKLLASGLLRTIFDNLYLLVIGKMFTAADLGYYNWAKRLQQTPTLMLATIVGNVSFPVFSSLQHDLSRLRQGMSQALSTLTFISFPMFFGLLVIAKPLVLLLLTEKWLPSVSYLQLLSLVGALYGWHALNIQVLLALGRSDLNLNLSLIKNGLRISNLIIMSRFGVIYIVIGEVITSFLGLYINAYYTKKLLGYGFLSQVKAVSPYFFFSILMVLAIYGFQVYFVFGLPVISLLLQVLLGGGVYLILSLFFKPKGFVEFSTIFKERIWVRLGR